MFLCFKILQYHLRKNLWSLSLQLRYVAGKFLWWKVWVLCLTSYFIFFQGFSFFHYCLFLCLPLAYYVCQHEHFFQPANDIFFVPTCKSSLLTRCYKISCRTCLYERPLLSIASLLICYSFCWDILRVSEWDLLSYPRRLDVYDYSFNKLACRKLIDF